MKPIAPEGLPVARVRPSGLMASCAAAGVERALELARYMAGYPQASIRSDREAILASYGRSVEEGLALEDEARRRSLSDGVMLGRLQAFARGDRPSPPSAE